MCSRFPHVRHVSPFGPYPNISHGFLYLLGFGSGGMSSITTVSSSNVYCSIAYPFMFHPFRLGDGLYFAPLMISLISLHRSVLSAFLTDSSVTITWVLIGSAFFSFGIFPTFPATGTADVSCRISSSPFLLVRFVASVSEFQHQAVTVRVAVLRFLRLDPK